MKVLFYDEAGNPAVPDPNKVWYLASPYSKHARQGDGGVGLRRVWSAACLVAAKCMEQGLIVHAPIPHSHPIAIAGKLDPLDHKMWMRQAIAMLDRCDGLLVARLRGWDESVGVTQEIERARETGKEVLLVMTKVENES